MRRLALSAVFALLVSFVAAVGGLAAPVEAAALSGPSKFVALPPARVLDSRIGLGYAGIVPPGGTVTMSLLGHGGVPASGVVAVLLNVTLAEAIGPGFVQVFPTGQAAVGASSNLNIEYRGQTIPNLAVAPLGVGGMVSIYTQGGGQLIADVFGYFIAADSSQDGRYVPVFPNRLLDTRIQPPGKLGAGGVVRVQVTGRSGVPAGGTAAAVLNVTATEASDAGYVQVLPTGSGAFGAYSNLNLAPGQTIPNLVVVPVGVDGSVTIFSERGTHVIVDVFGYFTNTSAPQSADGLFVPLSPTRLLDSRSGPMPANGSVTTIAPLGRGGIPASGVAAVFGNVTATNSTGGGYVQVVPGPASAAPVGFWSNVNLERSNQTIPNAAIANLGTDGTFLLYTANATHLLFDASGYFTAADTTTNHLPTITPIDRAITGGSSIDIDVLDYASDPDGDPLHIAAFSQPSDGLVTLLSPGLLRYVTYAGPDRVIAFTVTVADNRGGSVTGTITVHVTAAEPNQPPNASTIDETLVAGSFIDIDVVASSSDPDGDPLRIAGFTQPASGVVQQVTSRILRYFAPGFATTTAFTFTVSDDRGGLATATAIMRVVPAGPPAAPSALAVTPLSWSNPVGQPATGQFMLRWNDNATNESGYRIYQQVSGNCMTPNGRYLLAATGPNATSGTVSQNGYSGRYCGVMLEVVAYNGAGESSKATFQVNAPVPNPPQIVEYRRLDANTVQISWTHDPVLGFETRGFVLRSMASNSGAPPYGQLGGLTYSVSSGPATQTLQAEESTLLPTGAGPVISTGNGGYTGSGYLGFWGYPGQTARFSVYAASAGPQTFSARYRQADSDTPSTRTLSVNGAAITTMSFLRTTGSWVDANGWSEQTATVNLAAGWNTIDLTHPGPSATNWIDLDRVSISTGAPAGDTAQAESALRLPPANPPALSTDSGGYSGTGYIGYWGYTGQSVRFTINASVAGTQTISLRYRQADSDTPSTRSLTVNGASAGTIAFPRSANAWADPNGWREVTATVNLNAGSNTIELTHPGPNGTNWLDLDRLTLANGRPVYTATVAVPSPTPLAYQCVSVMALNNAFYAGDLQYSASSPGTCLS